MALIESDNRDVNDSGTGVHPLSVKPFGPGQTCSNAVVNRVIALVGALDPLAFRAFLPPQRTVPDEPAPLPKALPS
jgi:hypothetical protein